MDSSSVAIESGGLPPHGGRKIGLTLIDTDVLTWYNGIKRRLYTMEEKKMTPQKRYNKKYVKRISFDFVTTTESDILEKLNSVPNKAGYIKALIRADIAANGIDSESTTD